MKQLIELAKRLDNHWIGDLIGAISIFATGWLLLVAGYVFGG